MTRPATAMMAHCAHIRFSRSDVGIPCVRLMRWRRIRRTRRPSAVNAIQLALNHKTP